MATTSQTQNALDLEDQENEFIVLESILDKEQFVYNRHTDVLPSGQIQVDIELPKEFGIIVKSRVTNVTPPLELSEGESSSVNGNGGVEPVPAPAATKGAGDMRAAEITYLPPITLLFTLPLNYPSKDPPLYTLQSNWLDRHALSQLCHSLDCLWTKNQGTVILFSWITFLREETLKIIGCDKQFEVVIHPPRRIRHGSFNKEVVGLGIGESPQSSSATITTTTATTATTTDDTCSTTTIPLQQQPTRNRLRSHHNHHPLDQRAVFANPSIRDREVLFNFLIEYSKEREEIEFRRLCHTCEVCFTDKAGTDFMRLRCGHFFCKDCMGGCYTTHIKEGGIDNVKCLAVKCSGMPSSAQVLELVGGDLFERYDGILLQRALEGMSDMIYCPRTRCGKAVLVEADEKLAWCSHCLYRFCAICKMVYHGVEPCRLKSDEKLKLFESYTNASKEEQLVMEKTYGKKQLSLMVQSTLSENYIEKESKPCPHCKIPIEKFEGCNKVTCLKCGAYFCWMCAKQLDKGNPYHHYQDPLSPCFNQLFQNVGDSDEDFAFSDEDDDDDDWD